MIVRSATGPVDLSRPENIRRGMAFRSPHGEAVVVTEPLFPGEKWNIWRTSRDGSINLGDEMYPYTFLGCDPARTTRGDCERFGLAPGIDAGAHGFARTREGFAVDMRRVAPPGTVYRNAFGARYTKPEGYRDGLLGPDRFIGLHAGHASAEDVERLCCGAHRNKPQPGVYLVDAARCTLAIGHNGDHEALASGVKWAAETAQRPTRNLALDAALSALGSSAKLQIPDARDPNRILAEMTLGPDSFGKASAPSKSTPQTLSGDDIAGKETGQACPDTAAARPRLFVHDGNVAQMMGFPVATTTHVEGDKVRVWTHDGSKMREMAPSEYDVVRLGPCTVAPDFKVSTAWADVPVFPERPAFRTQKVTTAGASAGSVVYASDLNEVAWTDAPAFPKHPVSGGAVVQVADNESRWVGTSSTTITLASAEMRPGDTIAICKPGGDPINLTPQAAALRAAMATIEALPWPAAEKRALRDAAHAVAEMVEATDGKAPAMLRGPVTEMLAALATAVHVGPTVVKDAELARGAAALMMPKRRAK